MVRRIFKLCTLVRDTGVKDIFDAFADEPFHMSVRKLCRITFRFTGNRFDAKLIYFPRARRREDNTIFKRREEPEPKRIVFIHI